MKSKSNEADPRWYELRNAVYRRDFLSADAQLARSKELLCLANPIGETVLHFLAVEDDLEGVKWLFGKGADLNTRNLFGTPLLFEVAQVASEALFSWLVEHGADPRATDAEGLDIVEFLEQFDHDERIKWVRKHVD